MVNEFWVEDDTLSSREEHPLRIMGVNPNGPKAQQWARSMMDVREIEEHCPGFSTLQIPYMLDHLMLNPRLFNVRIKKVAAGDNHCLFLTEDGFVYGMGNNTDSQLLIYNKNHELKRGNVLVPTLLLWFVECNVRVKDIACAGCFSAFVTTDDELYTVGRFRSNYMTTEPVRRHEYDAISVFGVGDEHLVFQCSPQNGDQVYGVIRYRKTF